MASITTTSQKLARTLSIKDEAGNNIAGTLVYEDISRILNKVSGLFHSGFITIEEATKGATINKKVAFKLQYKTVEGNTTRQKLRTKDVNIFMENYDKVVFTSDSADMALFTKTGDLRGVIIESLSSQKLKLIGARFFKKIIDTAKSKDWEVTVADKTSWKLYAKNNPTAGNINEYNPSFVFDAENDSTYPKSDESGKILYDLLDETLSITNLIDQHTDGISKEKIVIFVTPKTFLKITFALGRFGHAVQQILENRAGVVVNGISIYEDNLLGNNFPAGVLHDTESFNFTSINAIILVKNDGKKINSATTVLGFQQVWTDTDPDTNDPISGDKFVSSSGIVALPFIKRIKIGTTSKFTYSETRPQSDQPQSDQPIESETTQPAGEHAE